MARITLVYPAIANIGFNSFNQKGNESSWLNFGLCSLSSYLKKHNHKVDLIDLRQLRGWLEYKNELIKRKPQFVGVHMNTMSRDFALKSCQIAKKLGMTTVVGGPHPTIALEDISKFNYIDHIVLGEGEISLNELVSGKISDRIILGKHIENLDKIPFPDRELFDFKNIIKHTGYFPMVPPIADMLCSRGCPYNCAFCQPCERKIFGEKVRWRSVRNIIKEIDELIEKYKIKTFMFSDDTFTVRKDWVLQLCLELKKRKIYWVAQTRSNTLTEELAEAMKEAGCIALLIGFESGSQRMLNFLRKGITVEQSLKAAKICKKYGIIISANFMVGLPTETDKEVMDTVELIRKIKPEIQNSAFYTPYPGTDLEDYCKKRSLIKAKKYEDYVRTTPGKIKGKDYDFLQKIILKTQKTKTYWFQKPYFTKIVLERWAVMVKQGMFLEVVLEMLYNGGVYKSSIEKIIKNPLQALRYFLKV